MSVQSTEGMPRSKSEALEGRLVASTADIMYVICLRKVKTADSLCGILWKVSVKSVWNVRTQAKSIGTRGHHKRGASWHRVRLVNIKQ
jgi:hypothetical protein